MSDLTHLWGGPLLAYDNDLPSPEEQLRQRMIQEGFSPPSSLYLDDTWQRFSTNGKKDDKAGWYIANAEGIPSGSFGDWRTNRTCYWRADNGRTLTAAEEIAHNVRRASMKDAYEKEKN